MTNASFSFEIARRLLRCIPNQLTGKTRIRRAALRILRSHLPVRIPDRYGNSIWCPSLDEPIAAALFASGVYEKETIDTILSHLPFDGTYIDVGANVGAIALPVAARRPNGRVICVEADPAIAAILQRNKEENGRSNITAVECVAGSEEKAISFYSAPAGRFGMGSIGPQFDAVPITLKQRTLDGILDELDIRDVNVVKLDIEGAELGALRGLSRRLASANPPVVIFEFADWAEGRISGQNPGDAQAFLISIGYRIFHFESGGISRRALDTPVTCGSGMFLALR